jgi:DNA invertase Pin-like site-specific DNA recombinase
MQTPEGEPTSSVSMLTSRTGRRPTRLGSTARWQDAWLADEGVSGAVSPEERKRFKAALALLEAGEVEALIFTKVDRESRYTKTSARKIGEAPRKGSARNLFTMRFHV